MGLPEAYLVTDWFPGHIKPVHKGYYHTCVGEGIESAFNWYWNGKEWMFWSPEDLLKDHHTHHTLNEPCGHQDWIWRGLKSPGSN